MAVRATLMAVLSVSTLRQRVQNRISGALSSQGWKPSRYVHDLFGRDTDQITPRAFSVGVMSTTPIGDRQKLNAGTYVQTDISVKFAWRLRGDAQLADFDEALTAEEDLLVAVMGTSLSNLHIQLEQIPQRQVAVEGQWFLGELIFRAEHRLPLT